MKLFYAKGASSLGAHIVLEELGVAYSAQRVDPWVGKTWAPEYVRMNPMGRVPLLILDDGTTLLENSAILQYLADRNPKLGLLPEAGTKERYKAIEWLGFITSELHKGIQPLASVNQYVSDVGAQKELRMNLTDNLAELLEETDQKLTDKEFCLGGKFSACDAYLLAILNACEDLKMDLSSYASIKRVRQNIMARPAVQKVIEAEQVETHERPETHLVLD